MKLKRLLDIFALLFIASITLLAQNDRSARTNAPSGEGLSDVKDSALRAAAIPEVNRSILEMAFAQAGNRDYTIKIIPNMNHSLVVSKRGGRKEVTSNRLAPGLIFTRTQWLQSHLGMNKGR